MNKKVEVDSALHKHASIFMAVFGLTTLILIVCITFGLYLVSLDQQGQRLSVILESQIALIDAVARFDAQYSDQDYEGGAEQATLSQIREAYSNLKGFGRSGQFILAKAGEGEKIIYLARYRSDESGVDDGFPEVLNMESELAAPMRLALNGNTGVLTTRDYRNKEVLAAYGYIRNLNYGVVIQMDMAEIRLPFIELGLINFFLGLGLDFLALFILRKINRPIVRQVAEREQELHSILQSSSDGIMRFNEFGECTFANHSSLLMLGIESEKSLIGASFYDFFISCDCEKSSPKISGNWILEALKAGKEVHRGDDCFIRADGSCFPVAYSVMPLFSESKLVGSVVTFNDITERKGVENRLHYLAVHDHLTGLLNRQGFTSALGQELSRSLRYKSKFCLLMLDLDHFKQVNDSHGHLMGDHLLRSLSQVVREHIRASDSAARYGGEEFVVILPETTQREAMVFAERLRLAIAEHEFVLNDTLISRVTVSIGVASYPDHGRAGEAILSAADKAMYVAKAAGRNCVRQFQGAKG